MIKERSWDSRFFKRKIADVVLPSGKPHNLASLIETAKADGFVYLTCAIRSKHMQSVRLLESLSFYLSDVGVLWEIDPSRFTSPKTLKNLTGKGFIRSAVEEDLPELKKISHSLFLDSRFYQDPFYSTEEADNLYQTWIENSVTGRAADAVFYAPRVGFITCRKRGGKRGEIILIGVKKGYRNKGVGSALIAKALAWFRKEGVTSVQVRTQMKNIRALRFYQRLGFLIKDYDLIYAKML